MHALKVHLFGKFSIEAGGHPLPSFESIKAQELFWYLLCHRDRPLARESLAELLWRNSAPEQSKKYLRQALWHLQHVVNAAFKQRRNPVILAEHDYVTLRSQECLWLDVAEYETTCTACAKVRSSDLTVEQTDALLKAVELYRGDLLEGCYQDWCLCERERLKNIYLNTLNKLLGYSAKHGDLETGVLIGGQILSIDNVSELTHQKLMKLYYLAGDRPSALRQYTRCRQALQEELGVKPSKSTVELYEQIRNDKLLSGLPDRQPAVRSAEISDPLPEILSRLQQLHTILTDLQQSVHEEIQAVEDVLRQQRPALH